MIKINFKYALCAFLALLITHSDKCSVNVRYYVHVTFQNGQTYEEFVSPPYLEVFTRSFVSDSSIESVFFTRDINYVPKSDYDR